MSIPNEVRKTLDGGPYHRRRRESVSKAIQEIRAPVPASFREFFEVYEGPFASRHSGFELLDLFEGKRNILSVTEDCRHLNSWPTNFVVLTDLLGNAVLVLDAATSAVFNVDFEGGDSLLLAGELPPSWATFEEFLGAYFGT